MHIEKLTCSSCGSNQLDEIALGRFQCPYCQASFLIDYDPGTGELKDALLKGDAQSTQVFAVHGKLTVKGDANKIWTLENSAEAQHVGNLDVLGDANTIRVVLLDGASCDLEGDANRVKRATGHTRSIASPYCNPCASARIEPRAAGQMGYSLLPP